MKPLKSFFRSKMLHIIPEEAPEDEEEEAQPGSSEESSDELSEDDVEDLGAPPKTQLSLFYFMSDCRNILNCVLLLICISREKEMKAEQNPKGTVSSPHSNAPATSKNR